MTNTSLIDETSERPPLKDCVETPSASNFELRSGSTDDSVQERDLARVTENPLTTLIVSESSHDSGFILSRLSEAGFENVQIEHNGTDAIDLVRQQKPILVLLDADLPGRTITLAAINGDEDKENVAVVGFQIEANNSDSRSPDVRILDSGRLFGTWSRHITGIRDAISKKYDSLSTDTTPSFKSGPVAREPRYIVPKGQVLGGSIELDGDGENSDNPGRLTDLSSHGAKLHLSIPAIPGTSIVVRVLEPAADIDFSIKGEVRWCHPCAKQEFRMGCQFESELSIDILQRLAAFGLLERRSTGRRQVMITTMVREELAGTGLENGRIVDYCSDGLRLWLPAKKEIGQRLLVHVSRPNGDEIAVPVRTLWQRNVDDGCEVGCGFLNKSGYELIQRADLSSADATRESAQKPASASINLSGIWWVGLVSIIVICFIGTLEVLKGLMLLWALP